MVIALVSAILEVTVPNFTFAFLSIAALVAMAVAFCAGLTLQVLAFASALFLALIFIRPRLLARLQKDHKMVSRSQALVGSEGEVSEAIDPAAGSGRVMVRGQDWAAKSDRPIALGKVIQVESHDGIVLIVKEP